MASFPAFTRLLISTGGLTSLLLVGSVPVSAQTGANVLVVANGASDGSVRIAEHYAKARLVPDSQLLRLAGLPPDPPDDIDRPSFERLIQAPIARWLTTQRAQDRIHLLVLTKGMPLRVRGSVGRAGTVASVDSELTLLYRRMTGKAVPPAGPVPNPYFLGDRPVADASPFSHESHDVYLVTRLDGFTVDDAIRLVDFSLNATSTGQFLLDEKASWFVKGNLWLRTAAERLRAAGLTDRVVLEQTSQVLTNRLGVLGYYSWGSNDPAIKVRTFGLTFLPGALGATFVSSDARTFREPPEGWKTGTWSDRSTYFAGSPQSLTGDLIREGLTGSAGHVAEPFLDATIRPDILFPSYVSGRSLGESFYLAMPYLSWQTVVVGDPLCAPFGGPRTDSAQLDPALDPVTELPRWFSVRRVQAAKVVGVPDKAVALFVRAENQMAFGNRSAAREALEEATSVESRFLKAQEGLASLYEQEGLHDEAIARYREIVKLDSRNVAGLNNLAYALATRKNEPTEALPLAQRARVLAPRSAAVLDTLGWVYHLLGDSRQALPLILEAVKGAPRLAETRLHAAQVYYSVGRKAEALLELDRAIELDPSISKRAEAIQLRSALESRSPE